MNYQLISTAVGFLDLLLWFVAEVAVLSFEP